MGERNHNEYLYWYGQCVRNEWMPNCLMEMKIIIIQRAEFKGNTEM